ncbi:EF-hand domain-containing protein [Actinosynnema sp. NPDC020468]|uniref:EF-hand domain-containing protein n=1 Tax=Actinosynnema sp. NPDC020468 TaxID=3154488 RepID=UPI0033D22230
MSANQVLRQKYASTFDNFDVNGSGTVDAGDLEGLIDRVVEQFGIEADGSRHQAFAASAREVWARLTREVGRLRGGGEVESIDRDEYLRLLETAPDDVVEAIFDPYVDGLFALADVDGDGRITEEEFNAHQLGWGLSPEQVRGSFQELDTDRDGTLSRAEYTKYVHQFFTSGDPNARANALSGA